MPHTVRLVGAGDSTEFTRYSGQPLFTWMACSRTFWPMYWSRSTALLYRKKVPPVQASWWVGGAQMMSPSKAAASTTPVKVTGGGAMICAEAVLASASSARDAIRVVVLMSSSPPQDRDGFFGWSAELSSRAGSTAATVPGW